MAVPLLEAVTLVAVAVAVAAAVAVAVVARLWVAAVVQEGQVRQEVERLVAEVAALKVAAAVGKKPISGGSPPTQSEPGGTPPNRPGNGPARG
jgi:hypothetical protein